MLKKKLQELKSLLSGHAVQSHQLIRVIELEETEPPALLTGLVFLLSGMIVMTFIWAMITRVDETASAQGRVIPEGDTMVVQHLEGGIVSEILVKEGDIVVKGQKLLRLSPTEANAELAQMRTRSTAIQLELERHRAVAEDREPMFIQVEGKFISIRDDQSTLFRTQKQNFEIQRGILKSQLEQQLAEQRRLDNKIVSLQKQVGLLAEEEKLQRQLNAKGLGTRRTLLGVERELETTRADLKESRDLKERTWAAIEEVRQRLSELHTTRQTEALTRISELSTEAAELEESIKVFVDRAERRDVLAPAAGIIQHMAVTAVNSVIRSGDPIMEIVPYSGSLLVEARVDPKDIGHINPGQDVDLRVSTFDYSRYGSLPGKLVRLSATTFQGEQGEFYYLALIKPTRPFVGGQEGRNQLLPGMVVQANIKTGRKSVFEYLMKPITRGFSSAFTER